MTSVKGDSESVPAVGEPHVAALTADLLRQLRASFSSADWEGLRVSHFRLLSKVPPDGITITELGQELGMTKQASGQFVAFLADTGHVQTRVDPADGRARVVVLTARGERTVKAVNAHLLRMERRWAKAVGPQRYADFRQVLIELGETS